MLAKDLASKVFVAEGLIPPGMFVPPHVHTREDEISYVLEGEVHFLVGDEHIVANAGSCVQKPRGVHHAFWNASTTHARLLEIVSPGNLDDYFPRLAAVFQADLAPAERARRARDLHEQYGIHYDPELEREVVARFAINGTPGAIAGR